MSKLSDISSPPILIPIVLPHSGDTSSGRVRNLPVSPQAVPRMLERRSGGAYHVLRIERADIGELASIEFRASWHEEHGTAAKARG